MKTFVNTNCGYTIFKDVDMVENIRSIIYQDIINKTGIDEVNEILNGKINEENFNKIKDKKNRILSKNNYLKIEEAIKQSQFLNKNPIKWYITDEENLGYPNVYWRYVKSKDKSGVGPIHADKWFWDLNGYRMEKDFERIKIWMPLYQPNDSAFTVLEGSQKNEYNYQYMEEPSGKRKPIFKQENIESKMEKVKFKIGEFIIFNDKLLHGGVSLDTNRVSVEWTMAIK